MIYDVVNLCLEYYRILTLQLNEFKENKTHLRFTSIFSFDNNNFTILILFL